MTQPAHAYNDNYGLRRYNIESLPINPLSITTLLKVISPARPLERWMDKKLLEAGIDAFEKTGDRERAIYMGAESRFASSEEADFGSSVHLLTEQADMVQLGLLKKITPVSDMKKATGFLKQWERLRDSFSMQILAVETTFVNTEFLYAGTADRIVICPSVSPDPIVLDLKSGKGVYGSAALQMAALANCDKILYDDGTLADIPWQFNKDVAVVAHLRPRSGHLIPMNIAKAWPLFQPLPKLALWRADQIKVMGEPLVPDEEAALRADLRYRIQNLPPDLRETVRAFIANDSLLAGGNTVTWSKAQLSDVEDMFLPLEKEARERLAHVIRLWGDKGDMELRAKVLMTSGRTSSVKELTAAEIDQLVKTFGE